MKYPDEAEASFAKETKSLPWCSHGLHEIHLYRHLLHTPPSHGSHSCACTPNSSVDYRLHIHRCKPKSPATQRLLLEAQWFSDEHWEAFELVHLHIVESSQIWVAFLSPEFPDRELPLTCFCGLHDLFWLRLPGCLYVLLQHKPHQTQLCPAGLRQVFFITPSRSWATI